MDQESNDKPPADDFRASPEFAVLLDRLVEAAQGGDSAAVERILAERPEWRPVLEEERDFLAHIEGTRPAAPAALSLQIPIPAAVYELPMPLAQAWLAMLDATTTPDRIEAAHFTVETYAVYLLAASIGAYDASGEEDAAISASLRRLAENGKPQNWLEAMDTVIDWSSSSSSAGGARPAERGPALLPEILSRLYLDLDDPAVLEIVEWLGRLHDGRPRNDGPPRPSPTAF